MLWRTLHEADALKHPSHLGECIPPPPFTLPPLPPAGCRHLQQQVASSPDEFLHPW